MFALGLASSNLRHEIKQSNKGRLQERRGRLQNVLEQRRQAEVAEASTSTQSFGQASLSGTRRDTVASISSVTTQTFGRKEDVEKKRLEALERKKEGDFLAAREKSEIKVQFAKKGGTQKMSRAQIREDAEKREAIARGKDPAAKTEVPLEEDVNRDEAETAIGQLISKCPFGVIVWSKIATKIL